MIAYPTIIQEAYYQITPWICEEVDDMSHPPFITRELMDEANLALHCI
jgi:hypothetical protein